MIRIVKSLSALYDVENIVVVQICLTDESTFMLVPIWLHQRVPCNDFVMFLTSWLLQNCDLFDYLVLDGDSVSIELVADLNFSKGDRDSFKNSRINILT